MGSMGRLEAINVEAGKSVWVVRQRAPVTSGVLATADGLAFVGCPDRMFDAYDAQTDALLWSARLNRCRRTWRRPTSASTLATA